MFVGLDVGGTNTDAVLMGGTELLNKIKVSTTPDVTSGIVSALEQLLVGTDVNSVSSVMLGTTHFTNALLEQKGLSPTAVVRLCLPATQLLPPLVDWPSDLKSTIGGVTYMVSGGHEFDGREISPLDFGELKRVVSDIKKQSIGSVAITGVFSPVDPIHEQRVGDFFRQELPHVDVTLSHENGRVGILERENAAVLNACLRAVGRQSVKSIKEAMLLLGLKANLYLSQNDGTLMDETFALRLPVLAISSGPTNSMRGAAYLSQQTDCIVVDVGGTTTDVGALVNGFPREASVAVNIAGVRTNFRMPDVQSIALGGGSVVGLEEMKIGPESVAFELKEKALIFGGDTLTTTDIAAATGLIGSEHPNVLKGLDPELCQRCLGLIKYNIEELIDRMKLNPEPVPIVLVGGGNVIVPQDLKGASEVSRPEHGEVANAIGAAIAQIGGQVEKVFALETIGRDQAVEEIKLEATKKAISAGAQIDTVEVVEVDEIPLTYLPGNVTLIRAKAVGDLESL